MTKAEERVARAFVIDDRKRRAQRMSKYEAEALRCDAEAIHALGFTLDEVRQVPASAVINGLLREYRTAQQHLLDYAAMTDDSVLEELCTVMLTKLRLPGAA